jgi:hypothetical protein
MIIPFAVFFQMETNRSTNLKVQGNGELSVRNKVELASASANTHADNVFDDTNADPQLINARKLYLSVFTINFPPFLFLQNLC